MKSDEKIESIRHSLAHLLAAAVGEIYPNTKRAIGPVIENGFYYDFEFSSPISEDDLAKIEKKMKEILPSWDSFKRHEINEEEARKEFEGNPYKTELIKEYTEKGERLSVYEIGGFRDLCIGGHTKNPSKDIDPNAFKLSHIAGAYWRGNEKNKMLTRIYGLAFKTEEELTQHLERAEEAKRRDHKKLGVELDLFTFSDLVGAGLPLWTPKGTLLRKLLDSYVWELRKERGYVEVEIPHITKHDLYKKSGHWEKFGDELFRITTREKHEFAMKPMNCPHHTQIYDRRPHSYRELPQRYANTTMVYRDEQSGELSGLLRVRSITQDDAHVFCRHSQIKEEMLAIWDIITLFYEGTGRFMLTPRLSLHDPNNPEKYLGTEDVWQEAEDQLRAVAKEKGVSAEEVLGEAAFYGPKIDFMAKDSLGREWQLATIQLDMNLPERFDLTCTNENGEKERIVMIHAAIMGSIERYLSVLIEHFAGAFPLWLSPVQIKVLPISQKHAEYAEEIWHQLSEAGIRAEVDQSDETLGKKIRNAQMQKIPYHLVLGDKEINDKTVTIESRDRGKVGAKSIDDAISMFSEEIKQKK